MSGDIQKPNCPKGMIEPNAWPEASEGRFYQTAQDCVNALQNLAKNSTTPWNSTKGNIFGVGGWSGDASQAASSKAGDISSQLSAMENTLHTAASWNYDMSNAIVDSKNEICGNVHSYLRDFDQLSEEDQNQRISECYALNLKATQRKVGKVFPPDSYRPTLNLNSLITTGLPTGPPGIGAAAPGGPPSAPPSKTNSDPLPPTTEPQHQQVTPEAAGVPGQPSTSSKTNSDPLPTTTVATEQPVVHQNVPPVQTATSGKTNADPLPAAAQPGTPTNTAATPVTNTPTPGNVPAAGMVTPPPPSGPRQAASTSTGGGTATTTGSTTSASGLGGLPSGSGTPQSGNPSGQPTGAQTPGGQPNNPLQQGLQQFGQGLQSGAGNASQPLASAQPATQQPTTPPPATPTGAASGTPGTSAAPVGAASAAGGGGSIGGPAAGTPAAPAAPLGPAPTPSPAAPVAQPGQAGPVGSAGPGVAAAGTNNQQAAAAAAPIPVSPARAERDAMAAAAKAGLLQRKSAGNTDADIEIARRISAALHAPPSIPAASYQFVWAVGVTSEGQILVANSYGIGYIPDGVKLPGQVTLVSADEAISPAERGRWVNFPFLAVQGWAQFHGKTLRAIIGTPEEIKPYKASMHAEELAPDDIPADGTMQGRSRLQVIAPEAAARLEEWSDVTLYEALPPRPVQDAPPDAKQTMKLWVEAIKPLLRTTGTNGPIDHLIKLIAYADHMQNVELYKAYTAPHVAAQREAMSDWIYWQHISSICQDATNPVLGTVQA